MYCFLYTHAINYLNVYTSYMDISYSEPAYTVLHTALHWFIEHSITVSACVLKLKRLL